MACINALQSHPKHRGPVETRPIARCALYVTHASINFESHISLHPHQSHFQLLANAITTEHFAGFTAPLLPSLIEITPF